MGKKKGMTKIAKWADNVTNHFWHCCKECDGDAEKLEVCPIKVHYVELVFCFLVTNYIHVYPDKIDRLTYHLIAKVTPVLSEKSP